MNNVVTTLVPSFFIGSSSFLQSYLPLSVWKNPHRLIMGEML